MKKAADRIIQGLREAAAHARGDICAAPERQAISHARLQPVGAKRIGAGDGRDGDVVVLPGANNVSLCTISRLSGPSSSASFSACEPSTQ